ncbi:MAG: 50S ribosomal protein L29 [Planctomycetota bacterium]|nr:50S ribosomal protein L29 [Planctomycetota bacterium]
MKATELRDKSELELRETLRELRKELFDAQFRAGQDEVEERGKTRKTRREVARILTIIRERELAQSAGATSGEES